METTTFLDETKENVQPLRKGRRADHLGIVLQAQTSNEAQMELDQQRQQYEIAIRIYEGDDPLEPRYEFAHWIEQSYPSLGIESKFIDLLEDTINLYKDDERYKQDPRFIEMLIKYINFQINPLELYQLAYNQGLGTMCSMLYLAWAEKLEENQDWKRANQVYDIGIRSHAEPLEDLKRKHEQFQLSFGRHMIIGDVTQSKSPESANVSRQVLSKLHKSSVIGTRTAKGNPGVLRSQPSVFGGNNQRSSAISIFQEDSESGIASGAVRCQLDRFPKAAVINKENALKAGPWKDKKSSDARSTISSFVIGRNFVSSSRSTPVTPSFQVLADEEESSTNISHQTTIVPRVLKPIRSEVTGCPPTIFENSDPNVKHMYPKHKIYVGGREFQLEELKAAQYFKKHNLNCSQYGDKYGFQTPMVFRQKTGTKKIEFTPSSMPNSVPVRLFADNSPSTSDNSPSTSDNSQGESTPIGVKKLED